MASLGLAPSASSASPSASSASPSTETSAEVSECPRRQRRCWLMTRDMSAQTKAAPPPPPTLLAACVGGSGSRGSAQGPLPPLQRGPLNFDIRSPRRSGPLDRPPALQLEEVITEARELREELRLMRLHNEANAKTYVSTCFSWLFSSIRVHRTTNSISSWSTYVRT